MADEPADMKCGKTSSVTECCLLIENIRILLVSNISTTETFTHSENN